MQELRFVVTAAPMPDGRPEEIKRWIVATELRLADMKGVISDLGIDNRVLLSASDVSTFLQRYRNFLDDLRLIDFAVEVRMIEADPDLRSIAGEWSSDIIPIAVETVKDVLKRPALAKSRIAVAGLQAIGATGGLATRQWFRDDIRARLEVKLRRRQDQEEVLRTGELIQDRALCLEILEEHTRGLRAKEQDPRTLTGAEQGHETAARSILARVMRAYELAETDAEAAAAQFLAACELLSGLPPIGREFVDSGFRTPYLVMAGCLLEYESRRSTGRAEELARRSVACFRSAADLCPTGTAPMAFPALLAWGRALAKGGARGELPPVLALLDQSLAEGDEGELTRAARLYDLASLYSQISEFSTAKMLLERSYREVPRRDPFAMRDPELAELAKRYPEWLQSLVDHELTGGRWEWTGVGSKYYFYPGGVMLQYFEGDLYRGRWEVRAGRLHLTDRRRTKNGRSSSDLPDSSYPFRIQSTMDESELVLSHPKTEIPLRRTSRRLNWDERFPDRRVTQSGEWNWSDGRHSEFTRYSAIANLEEKRWEYWFTYEHPILGRVNSFPRPLE